MRDRQNGFGHVVIILVIAVLMVAGAIIWRVTSSNSNRSGQANASATWQFDGSQWRSSGNPPACSDPISLPSPVEVSKVTSILYPGQYRGGNYKSHGGFRFADNTNNDVTVKAPLDATLVKGSRYIEQGETQYFFVFINACGIMYRFDHLLTLTPDFQKYADTLPQPKVDDSRTTNFNPQPNIKAGTTVATGVGFKNTGNTSVDFGVYDLRQKNSASQTADWQQKHSDGSEFDSFAICWLHNLSGGDSTTVLGLPAGDQAAGKQSDFCK